MMRAAAPSITLIVTLIVTLSPTTAAALEGGHVSQQGIRLHGTAGPSPFEGDGADIAFASATRGTPGRPYQKLGFKAGQLRGTIDSKPIEGAAVIGTQLHLRDHVLTITAASPHRNIYTNTVGTLWQYTVEWAPLDHPDAARPLCAPGYAALAVPGSWRTGQLQRDASVFTFACIAAGGQRQCSTSGCEGGVIAKCIDYGYAPWRNGALYLDQRVQLGEKFKLQKTDDSAVQLHNLCAAAMRADYEGDGSPHTINGTPIRVFDATNIGMVLTQNRTSLATLNSLLDVAHTVPRSLAGTSLGRTRIGSMAMEGVWTIDKTGRAHAACLEKTRWQTLDATKTSDCDSFVRALCSDKPGDDCEPSEIPLLVSYSAHIDRGLYRFSNGQHSITTTHVVTTAAGIVPDPAVFCPALSDCSCLAGYRLAQLEGTVLSDDLGDLLRKRAKSDPLFADLRALYSRRLENCQTVTGTDEVTPPEPANARPLSTGGGADGFICEGFLFSPSNVTSSPAFSIDDLQLSLWTLDHHDGRRYVTAVAEPTGEATRDRQVLGYVLRRAARSVPAAELLARLLGGR